MSDNYYDDRSFLGAYPKVDLNHYYNCVEEAIRAAFPQFVTVEFHRGDDGEDRQELMVPAILLEDNSMEPVSDGDMGDEVTFTTFDLSAYVILSSKRNPLVRREIRQVVAQLVNFIDKNRWPDVDATEAGVTLQCEGARVVVAERDSFDPRLDKYEVWRIDFTQMIPIGQSVWEGDNFLPERIFISYSPVIGLPHKDDYVELEKDQ